MKKLIINFIIIIIFLITLLIITLSTIGVKTNKFNKLISEKASKTKNIVLDLDTVTFKLDPKKISLFLETENPKINYKNIIIPIQNIKVFINFFSLFKAEKEIEKISLILEELDISQLNKLSIILKPSNLKSLLNNKIKDGRLVSEIEIFLSKDGLLKDFIAKGKIKNLKIDLFSNLEITNTSLEFFADKNDILIKKLYGKIPGINISDGDLKINLNDGIKLNSNFYSLIELEEKELDKYAKLLNQLNFQNKIDNFNAELSNNIFIEFDKTYKVKDYNYNLNGKIKKSKIRFNQPITNKLFSGTIDEIFFSDLKIKTIIDPKNVSFNGKGTYSIDNINFLNLDFDNNFTKESSNFNLDFDYSNDLNLDLINFKKSKNSIANLSMNIEQNKDNFKINKLKYQEQKNLIEIKDLILKRDRLLSFNKILIKSINNDFIIQNGKKIIIKGKKFDASNLGKYFTKKNEKNIFQKINNKIEINFSEIKVPMSEKLNDFSLIGEISEGKFIKISSKGDFGGNNFLDISMKIDEKSKRKYLEIYSDLTRPLLAEYNFFKGLSGGKLLFSSIIDGDKSNSKLKIENFKLVNAPGVIKLLSLADLGGLVDLAEGEGLSFDVLEIDMEKSRNFLKLNEILALGPSMSVLMEGYLDENGLTSLRGTLVPAKTLNKFISKIPVIGNIIIPKEVGEGLFGISFKMKGPKGKIKTTINPIKTLTPRFIQKIIDKKKNPR